MVSGYPKSIKTLRVDGVVNGTREFWNVTDSGTCSISE